MTYPCNNTTRVAAIRVVIIRKSVSSSCKDCEKWWRGPIVDFFGEAFVICLDIPEDVARVIFSVNLKFGKVRF